MDDTVLLALINLLRNVGLHENCAKHHCNAERATIEHVIHGTVRDGEDDRRTNTLHRTE